MVDVLSARGVFYYLPLHVTHKCSKTLTAPRHFEGTQNPCRPACTGTRRYTGTVAAGNSTNAQQRVSDIVVNNGISLVLIAMVKLCRAVQSTVNVRRCRYTDIYLPISKHAKLHVVCQVMQMLLMLMSVTSKPSLRLLEHYSASRKDAGPKHRNGMRG